MYSRLAHCPWGCLLTRVAIYPVQWGNLDRWGQRDRIGEVCPLSPPGTTGLVLLWFVPANKLGKKWDMFSESVSALGRWLLMVLPSNVSSLSFLRFRAHTFSSRHAFLISSVAFERVELA